MNGSRQAARSSRARHSSRGKSLQTGLPREHGFWVMLILTLLAGCGLTLSWKAWALALPLGAMATAGAMILRRVVRRSLILQAFSSLVIALLTVPLGLVGGASLGDVTAVFVPLSLVFLISALSVHGILFRAKKRVDSSLVASWAALTGALFGVFLSAFLFSWQATVALGVLSAFVGVVHFAQPSAKKLKVVGVSVTAVQAVIVALLII